MLNPSGVVFLFSGESISFAFRTEPVEVTDIQVKALRAFGKAGRAIVEAYPTAIYC